MINPQNKLNVTKKGFFMRIKSFCCSYKSKP